MTVLRNSFNVIPHGTYELGVWYKLFSQGPVCNNALTNCAALSCRALRKYPVCVAVRYL